MDPEGGGVVVPFSFAGVRLYARGAGALRICLSGSAEGARALLALDESGAAVLIGRLDRLAPGRSRPVSGSRGAAREDLFTSMRWSELSLPAPDGSLLHRAALVGGRRLSSARAWSSERYADLAALDEAIDDGGRCSGAGAHGAPREG